MKNKTVPKENVPWGASYIATLDDSAMEWLRLSQLKENSISNKIKRLLLILNP